MRLVFLRPTFVVAWGVRYASAFSAHSLLGVKYAKSVNSTAYKHCLLLTSMFIVNLSIRLRNNSKTTGGDETVRQVYNG